MHDRIDNEDTRRSEDNPFESPAEEFAESLFSQRDARYVGTLLLSLGLLGLGFPISGFEDGFDIQHGLAAIAILAAVSIGFWLVTFGD